MDNIHIQHMRDPRVGEAEVEIVERKGLGHPDTICDAVMESISQALSRLTWSASAPSSTITATKDCWSQDRWNDSWAAVGWCNPCS